MEVDRKAVEAWRTEVGRPKGAVLVGRAFARFGRVDFAEFAKEEHSFVEGDQMERHRMLPEAGSHRVDGAEFDMGWASHSSVVARCNLVEHRQEHL